ncbi:MAG TPA: alpha/beta hydrolase [Candidatus Saccharimonadales bacterium]|nr:alpha/beta hydrolase [Candidatus Saccharimonadales bacterium]
MPYLPPEDPRAARRARIWRWVSTALVIVLVMTLLYIGYVGYDGSGQLVHSDLRSINCMTPAAAFGWKYQAINYNIASDAALDALPDPSHCTSVGALAGSDVLTSDGVRIAGWYIPAAGGKGATGPTIILAHAQDADKSDMLPYAEILHARYNLVLFDFRNHGQSSGDQSTLGVTEQLDVKAVIDWLESAKKPTQVGLLGVAMGGSAAVNAADTDTRIRALILDSTHATLANALQAHLEKAGYPLSLPAAWAILLGGLLRTGQDMTAADPVQAVARYGARPLLILVGGRDDSIGPNDGADLESAARQGGADAQLERCADATHAELIQTCSAQYKTWTLAFLQRAFASQH